MATKAQTRANRANSQASTGPTTEAGKARSSQNATKHGLASGRLIIDGESWEDYATMKNSLRAEHQPSGPTESFLVEQMCTALWLVRRAIGYQAKAFDDAAGAVPATLSVLIRYQTTNERAFQKALDTLRKLQKERKEHELEDKIGFLQNATPEELMERLDEAYRQQHPGQPIPVSPEQREALLESLRRTVPKQAA